MQSLPRRRRQLGREDEGLELVLGAARASGVGVKVVAKVAPIEREAVRVVALEVVPDLLHGVELRRVGREPLDVQPRVAPRDLGKRRLVDPAPVPQQHDVSAQMPQQCPEEVADVLAREVLLLEADVEAHAGGKGRDAERRDSRDAVVPVVVVDDGGLPLGPPGATAGRDEQKAAFIEEDDVGTKGAGDFF